MNSLRAVLTAASGALLLISSSAVGQSLPRPERPWQTITTAHFDIHYPAEMRVWAEPVAQRMESVAAAVNALVGSAPRQRVTVLVEDPANISNGFALPFIEGPVVFFWPTPPAPSPTFGSHRGWGEILAVHEYGHIAHLTYPSRNSFDNFIWKFLPTRIGPIARKSPAWVIEGYATFIEGRLTGNGRPNSAGRAAVLRTWALDGKLPTYEQLNGSGAFLGGSMRYLVGSAFLEWLTERKGDVSLTNLWRRMSARQSRNFAEAFRGVYGAYPEEMYGRFFVEVMGHALEIDRQLKSEGIVDGELVQHYRWAVGAPAVSNDGRLVAIAVGTRNAPSRLEVWPANAEPDSATIRQRARLLARDSLDVPAVDSFPRPRKAIATLRASAGRSAEAPRFFKDNDRILVARDEPLGDGATRPDLYIWNYKSGGLHRVTHGAAIRSADPAPDGKSAVGAQCLNGICNLVLVDLEHGVIRPLVAGSPTVVWNRPRFAPDGQAVAASVQRDGHWHVAIITVATGTVQMLEPADGADRHSPDFTPDGRQLVVVSERGGISNLELLDLSGQAPRTVTRLISAASSPDVSTADGRAYFLTLHARGYDVRRIALNEASTRAPVLLGAQFFPVAPSPVALLVRPEFATSQVTGPHAYGTGPRRWRILPGGSAGAEGEMATLSLANTDPIGRVGVVAVGGYGNQGSWRGGSLAIETRRTPVHIGAAGWYTEQRPTEQRWSGAPSSFDATYVGAGGTVSYSRELATWGVTLRAGGTGGVLDSKQIDQGTRALGLGDLRGRVSFGLGSNSLQVTGGLLGVQGATAGDAWSLGLTRGTVTMATHGGFLRFEGTAGHVTPASNATVGRSTEQFLVGGAPLPFADAAFQPNRLVVPGLPVGFVSGQRVGVARIVLGGQLLEPSVSWIAGGDTRSSWKRVYALERELAFPSLGYARLPGVRVRAGVSYSVDAPYEQKLRPYFSLVYRP
ncbi:MAG: hypothetical protein ABI877_02035 [Gemmatimonadaceae bacterium]